MVLHDSIRYPPPCIGQINSTAWLEQSYSSTFSQHFEYILGSMKILFQYKNASWIVMLRNHLSRSQSICSGQTWIPPGLDIVWLYSKPFKTIFFNVIFPYMYFPFNWGPAKLWLAFWTVSRRRIMWHRLIYAFYVIIKRKTSCYFMINKLDLIISFSSY